jgi:hypothetical protein
MKEDSLFYSIVKFQQYQQQLTNGESQSIYNQQVRWSLKD